jgi:hypothetical protein
MTPSPRVGSSRGWWCSKAAGSDVTSATAGLMIVGLFQGSTKGDTTMAERARMTAAQLADKLLQDEHADVLRESVAWMARELMEPTSAPRSAPSLASAAWSGPPTATATAPATGTPGRQHRAGHPQAGGPAGRPAAGAGQVLVSQSVAERASLPGVTFVELGELPLKGIVHPVRLLEACRG